MFGMKLLKSAFCGVLAASMLLSLSACGKKAEIPLASKENIFEAKELKIPVELQNVEQINSYGDRIYLYGNNGKSLDNPDGSYWWENETKLVILDNEGGLVKDLSLAKSGSDYETNEDGISKNSYVNRSKMDAAGNLWLLFENSTYDEMAGTSEEQYELVKFDSEGNKSDPIDLTFVKDECGSDGYFYVNDLTFDEAGNIYIICNNYIIVLDSSAKLLFKIQPNSNDNGTSGSYINNVVRATNGKVYAVENQYSYDTDTSYNKYFLKEIDINTKGFGQVYESKKNLGVLIDGKGDNKLIMNGESSMSSYDFETDTITPIVDWMKSGFNSDYMQNPTIMSDGKILCLTYNYDNIGNGISYDTSNISLSILSKVDPADVPDKKLITIACWYMNYNVKQLALEFNKTNTEYQIEFKSYSEDDADYKSALTKMNNDLIAGNVPDILIIDQTMSIENYISKGMFADLYEFMDKDEEIKKEDYLQNIFDACSTDGKLYSLIPSFNVQTLIGKTSLVGDKSNCTADEFLNIINTNSSIAPFNEMTKSMFTSNILLNPINSYINRKTGECSFNSPQFIKLIEFANTFPDEIDYDALYANQNYYSEQQSAYRNNKTLFSYEYLSDFTSIRRLEKGTFNDSISFIGFPSEDGNGSIISPDLRLAIMNKGKNTEGAWAFMRKYLLSDYQDKLSYNFPIKLSSLDVQMEKAKEKPYYMNGEEKVEYENTYYVDDQEVNIGSNDDADNQKVLNLIKSLSQVSNYDQDLISIITEETGSYYSGQKTSAEVADIIQNRVSVYISESR